MTSRTFDFTVEVGITHGPEKDHASAHFRALDKGRVAVEVDITGIDDAVERTLWALLRHSLRPDV